MRKIHLGPEMGELDDGSDPAMSVGVATERADGIELRLSGLVHPEGTVAEQARTAFEMVGDVVCNDLGGRREDVTHLRLYVRQERLTPEVRVALHETRREFFTAPEYPSATMVGVADLVHEEADVEIEAEAFVPGESWDVETVLPEE